MHARSRIRAAAAALAVALAPALFALGPLQASAAAPGTPSAPSTPSALGYRPAACATPVPASERTGDAPYATCAAMGVTGANGKLSAGSPTPPTTALTPDQLRAAYDLPAGGAGATVAIIDTGGYASAESDLAVYRGTYGLPACTSADGCFRKLDQNGGHNLPPEDAGWSIETALDLDAVSAACPACRILLIEADSASVDDLGHAADTAATFHPVAISNSYGVPGEGLNPTAYDAYYDHPGIAVTASTGDYGNIVNWPASSGHVVAVGGTTLTEDGSTARGWTESAWDSGGSGCSSIEPKPAYQDGLDTGCNNRAIADISADADPASGLGIYNSSALQGWAQYGGTSLSSPLVAAMYALAGTPAPGTYPVTYPYQDTRATDLNDVTTGSDGYCGDLLCTAGNGWDGPTGLGTPEGVGALQAGPHGLVTGTVRNAGGGTVDGAAVTAVDANGRTYATTTDSTGSFKLAPAPGRYAVTATRFGDTTATATLNVAEGHATNQPFTLRSLPSHVVSGTVTDASGHGWPLAASISVDGYPGGAVSADPATGHYSLRLPDNGTYTMHVTSTLPGYQGTQQQVSVGTSDVRQDIDLPVDANACTSLGYQFGYQGSSTDFEGWQSATPQDDWTVTDDSGSGVTWRFDDPGSYGNLTGGSGRFASIDSRNAGNSTHETTTLVSPVLDLSGDATPIISFDNAFMSPLYNSNAYVEVSTDGGQTWTSVWHMSRTIAYGPEVVSIPQEAGKSNVRIRFRYDAVHSWYWQVDNIFVGNRSCDRTPGGLVAGTVSDDNTGAPLTGAALSIAGTLAATTTEGRYEVFAPASAADNSGRTTLAVADGAYTPSSTALALTKDQVTSKDWRLGAGRISLSGSPVRATVPLGRSATRTVTLRNTGTAPVHVELDPQDGSYTPTSHAGPASKGPAGPGAAGQGAAGQGAAGRGAAIRHLAGNFSSQSLAHGSGSATTAATATSANGSTAWTISDALPGALMDNGSVTLDGKVYTFGGTDSHSVLFKAYVHDPATGGWRRLANMPQALEKPGVEAVNGAIYLFGGWTASGAASAATYRYDPKADSWASVAPLPTGLVAEGTAVLGGHLYVVAGCGGNCVPASQATYVYDPQVDAWSQVTDYPITDSWLSCAGIDGQVICAGGTDPVSGAEIAATYALDPTTGGWTQRADLPYPNWAMASASSGGRLQVLGGVSNGDLTNQAEEYDPETDTWSVLPATNALVYRGSGACGLYVLGGADGTNAAVNGVEELPGYDDCGSSGSVAWLSAPHAVTVAPGATVQVNLTVDSSAVTAAGSYTSGLTVGTDSPYAMPTIAATMEVTAPKN